VDVFELTDEDAAVAKTLHNETTKSAEDSRNTEVFMANIITPRIQFTVRVSVRSDGSDHSRTQVMTTDKRRRQRTFSVDDLQISNRTTDMETFSK
jgi:hypothetical protein